MVRSARARAMELRTLAQSADGLQGPLTIVLASRFDTLPLSSAGNWWPV
jgi:hypothetical protein